MNEDIKEILRYLEECVANDNRFLIDNTNATKLSYYITNLQIDNKFLSLNNYKDAYRNVLIANKTLEKENQKLKEKLNCKEYFSSTMPEDTEFVILTKNNYDRQQKDLALENIKLKETNEEHRKINGDLRKENQKLVKVINELEKWLKEQDDEHQPYYGTYDYNGEYEDVLDKLTELKGGSDEKSRK